MGNLFLVATPIGNLEDITARAIRILNEVRLIAAEDTRRTKKLLSHYKIHTPMISYFEHSKSKKTSHLLSELMIGDIALVSDAGTPGLNDPGYELINQAIQMGHRIIPIPGPCAPIAALICSGFPTNNFLYLGYLPRKSQERIHFINEVINHPYTLIILETPHRMMASLRDLFKILGNRKVAIARELTKLHEEIYRGTLEDANHHFGLQQPIGEITIVIEGCTKKQHQISLQELTQQITDRISDGENPSAIARNLSKSTDWKKRVIYDIALEIYDRMK